MQKFKGKNQIVSRIQTHSSQEPLSDGNLQEKYPGPDPQAQGPLYTEIYK